MGSQPLDLFVAPDGNHCLRAQSHDDFRALGVRAQDMGDVDPAAELWLRWRWQVSKVLATADAGQRSGDDFAARVYLVFGSRWNPLAVRTLVYVWDNRHPVGALLPSAWAPQRARMVVLRSGDDDAGRWVGQQRNVTADYLRAFGTLPPPLMALVVAADTDQTGDRVMALFDDVVLTDSPPPTE